MQILYILLLLSGQLDAVIPIFIDSGLRKTFFKKCYISRRCLFNNQEAIAPPLEQRPRQALDYDDDVNKDSHNTPDDEDAPRGAHGFRMDDIRIEGRGSHKSQEENVQTGAQASQQAQEERDRTGDHASHKPPEEDAQTRVQAPHQARKESVRTGAHTSRQSPENNEQTCAQTTHQTPEQNAQTGAQASYQAREENALNGCNKRETFSF